MVGKIYRYLFVALCLFGAFFFFMDENYLNMSLMLLAAGITVYGHYRYGSVYAAFHELKGENYDKAEKLILEIKNPNYLVKSQRSYYHFTKGTLASHKGQWNESYSELTKALDLGLRTENDKSIVLLNLANVELKRHNLSQAKQFISEVRKIELNPLVKSETDRIEEEINAAQQ